ncbi:MAG: 2-hydroxyglutaryl-CoA dehydratase [Phycisphaerae bacterium]|nr:acyl-CoA dehydratase activase [Phycisphaerae bacterium]NUQ45833.1 2-hydroxyglutaryl-CoA dehydratase [Phycisphaerae bacterium]
MSYVAGIDLGAGTTKTVIVDGGGRIVGDSIERTRADFLAIGRSSLSAACRRAGIGPNDVDYIAATGFGRYSFDDRSIQITDLTCAARGAHALFPEARFVLDMGAQSTRAIALRDGGKVRGFRTNEKCAAGSGGFLERVARYLEVPLEQLGDISLESTEPQPISSVCAVLAESEIINHVSEGRSVADIVCGAHLSLAGRALSQLKMVGFDGPVVFVGGVALQSGMVKACEQQFGHPVFVPPRPSHVVAHGAALLGLQRLTRRAPQTTAA